MTIHDNTNTLLSLAKTQAQRHRGAATHLDYLTRELERTRDDSNFPMDLLAKLANYYGFCIVHSEAARPLLEMARGAIKDSEEELTQEVHALVPLLEEQIRATA